MIMMTSPRILANASTVPQPVSGFGQTQPLEPRVQPQIAQFGLFKTMSRPSTHSSSASQQMGATSDEFKNPLSQLGVFFHLLPEAMQQALMVGDFMVIQKGSELFLLPIPEHGNGKTATLNLVA